MVGVAAVGTGLEVADDAQDLVLDSMALVAEVAGLVPPAVAHMSQVQKLWAGGCMSLDVLAVAV